MLIASCGSGADSAFAGDHHPLAGLAALGVAAGSSWAFDIVATNETAKHRTRVKKIHRRKTSALSSLP